MSDPREDDEPVGIEADAPEADWIEQQQPVIDEDDDDVELFAPEVREDDQAISIEADVPEADWIEQHQPVVEEGDDDRVHAGDLPEDLVESGELEEEWRARDEDVGVDDEPPVPPPPQFADETGADERQPSGPAKPSAGGRGCNLLAALLHAALRAARGAATRPGQTPGR